MLWGGESSKRPRTSVDGLDRRTGALLVGGRLRETGESEKRLGSDRKLRSCPRSGWRELGQTQRGRRQACAPHLNPPHAHIQAAWLSVQATADAFMCVKIFIHITYPSEQPPAGVLGGSASPDISIFTLSTYLGSYCN